MNRQSTFLLLFLGILLLVGAAFFYSKDASTKEITELERKTPSTESPSTMTATAPATIALTKDGFSPSTLTVKRGTMVTWINSGGGNMWVASAMHPSHIVYGGTTLKEHCPDTASAAFDQCAIGATFTFMFDKVGDWKYHNHVDAGQYGSVTVTE